MFLYWRVQQDLYSLGEVIQFQDPSFIRCFREWTRRNAATLALVGGMDVEEWIPLSLN